MDILPLEIWVSDQECKLNSEFARGNRCIDADCRLVIFPKPVHVASANLLEVGRWVAAAQPLGLELRGRVNITCKKVLAVLLSRAIITEPLRCFPR